MEQRELQWSVYDSVVFLGCDTKEAERPLSIPLNKYGDCFITWVWNSLFDTSVNVFHFIYDLPLTLLLYMFNVLRFSWLCLVCRFLKKIKLLNSINAWALIQNLDDLKYTISRTSIIRWRLDIPTTVSVPFEHTGNIFTGWDVRTRVLPFLTSSIVPFFPFSTSIILPLSFSWPQSLCDPSNISFFCDRYIRHITSYDLDNSILRPR